jgi:hypothetical protein
MERVRYWKLLACHLEKSKPYKFNEQLKLYVVLRRIQWQKNLLLPRLNAHQNFQCAHIIDARYAVDLERIIGSLDFADCVSENLLRRAK